MRAILSYFGYHYSDNSNQHFNPIGHRSSKTFEVKMIQITDNDPSRLKAAIEFLKDSKSIGISGYNLFLDSNGDAEVRVCTRWNTENLTADRANIELNEARSWFQMNLTKMQDLGDFLDGRRFRFTLISDYGTGAINLDYYTELEPISK